MINPIFIIFMITGGIIGIIASLVLDLTSSVCNVLKVLMTIGVISAFALVVIGAIGIILNLYL